MAIMVHKVWFLPISSVLMVSSSEKCCYENGARFVWSQPDTYSVH